MFSVQCQNGALVGKGCVEYVLVTDPQPCHPGLMDRQHVIAQCSKFLNHREQEVLVGIKPRHASRLLVLPDLKFDFGAVRANESPGVRKVLGAKCWIATQQIGLTDSQPATLLQNPYRNSRSHDARDATADARAAFNARERVPKVARNPL
jgi:hypothetical protein